MLPSVSSVCEAGLLELGTPGRAGVSTTIAHRGIAVYYLRRFPENRTRAKTASGAFAVHEKGAMRRRPVAELETRACVRLASNGPETFEPSAFEQLLEQFMERFVEKHMTFTDLTFSFSDYIEECRMQHVGERPSAHEQRTSQACTAVIADGTITNRPVRLADTTRCSAPGSLTECIMCNSSLVCRSPKVVVCEELPAT